MSRVHVKTPSRLHFCLIDMNGRLGRVDGSLGVAIDRPSVELTAWLSEEMRVYGEEASKTEAYARRFLEKTGSGVRVSINVKQTIPEHVGLGSDTQLSLAVATCISRLLGLGSSTYELARIMGRGGTSGIGVAAFESGGLILDGGHSFGRGKEKETFLPSSVSDAPPAKVLARYDFPQDWGFILATPTTGKGAFGRREVSIFRELCPVPDAEVAEISRIILMKILPSLLEHDIETFGSGLSDLQNLGFAKAAKRLMHHATGKCIEAMLEGGAYGAGQSSFGPTAYGLIKSDEPREPLISTLTELLRRMGGGEVLFTTPNNHGAQVKAA
ncbi:MAG: beta-ribofuranosylaminobenzene 5'-phosphate synthase [Candidatus Bathyarchaeia archaeon]